MKILVVDDEIFICDLLYDFLIKQGYNVFTAFDGKEAREKYKQKWPDVVMLDISMPKMSGIEVLQEIMEINSHSVIIMLSAYGDSDTVRGTLKMGADYFLEKPIEFERLMNILNVLH